MEYMCLFESWFSLDRYPGVGFLDQMVVLCVVFWGISILFSTVAAPIYNPTTGVIGCGEKRTLVHCCRDCKLVQPLWKTVGRFLRKLNIELPFDPAIPLLGLYPEKIMAHQDTCTPMFIAALFAIAKTWKQPKFPINRGVDQEEVVHIHNGILTQPLKQTKYQHF